MSDYRGRFLWYELLTKDPQGAVDFYTKVLGWGTEEWKGMETPYRMWTRGGVPIGGLMEFPDEVKKADAPSHWLAYIGTPDVDATVAQAVTAGGKICHAPMDIPTVGRFAILMDPHGAMFAVYKPEQEPPPVASPQIGDCTWHELAAGDEEEAWDFYSGLFGWEKHGKGHDMGPMGTYQEFQCPGAPFPIGGVYKKPAVAPPHFTLYFSVPDVNPKAELVKSLGGQVLNGPMEVPGGDFIVNCLDPQGAAFSIHHRKQA